MLPPIAPEPTVNESAPRKTCICFTWLGSKLKLLIAAMLLLPSDSVLRLTLSTET